MKFLIDTHVFLWMLQEPKRLSARVASLLKSGQSSVFISAATPWEIAIKVRIGKLEFDPMFLDDFDNRIREEMAFEPLHITSAHAVAAGLLPGAHKDPFDRMLAGQAQTERLTLVSADPHFKLLGVDAVW